jgi:exodeoxyribonuclease VII large subunit
MAVPVRSELLAQTFDLERRYQRCFLRGLEDRRKHVQALARALPRADQLFGNVRQRFDHAAERLGHALGRNLAEHRRALAESAALLRPNAIARLVTVGQERVDGLERRLVRSQEIRLRRLGDRLDSSGRLLELVSHRSVLERGFVLVRSQDGAIRRRAKAVGEREHLSLVFADGEVGVQADGAKPPPKPPPKPKANSRPDDRQDTLL